MFKIAFTPVRSGDQLSLSIVGDVLQINGKSFDFSDLPEGSFLPVAAVACDAIASDVFRRSGAVCMTLVLPHGQDAPEAVRFPVPIEAMQDGPVVGPGLAEPVDEVETGQIDWSLMVNAQAADLAARVQWRETAAVSKLDLVLALSRAGLIGVNSAVAAAAGAIPSEFEPVIAAMPEPPRAEVRIRWAGAQEIPRISPMILAVQAALSWPDNQVDALFGWES